MMSLFISVLVLLFGVASGLTREYLFFSDTMSWNNAQRYCQQNYRDLATVTNAEENTRLYTSVQSKGNTWIGLYSRNNYWFWSDQTQSDYFPWDSTQPLNYFQGCAEIEQNGWNVQFCDQPQPFVCYMFLVLVNEKMTWKEAHEYCKVNYTGLASLAFQSQVLAAEVESNRSQTDNVWTGLRFLDGKWFWLSQGELWNLRLPSCPAPPYRCGARNIKTHVWENRDCNEKLNFLCYHR
ncbi:macrophage mannose receptor 1-like [Clarias gariepinus]|uniref:macrophage mannose receptor 1-like n=1 Tax=Clarias gariepinus TaxID=13013 RepID=UPI00234E13F5|nr:macrophage mannose receptor 1-like [Clarias gariepinus]